MKSKDVFKDIEFTLKYDREKQQILTFERLNCRMFAFSLVLLEKLLKQFDYQDSQLFLPVIINCSLNDFYCLSYNSISPCYCVKGTQHQLEHCYCFKQQFCNT